MMHTSALYLTIAPLGGRAIREVFTVIVAAGVHPLRLLNFNE